MRVGVLGGTFDPVHVGHVVVAQAARQRLDLAAVRFVPSRRPPHKERPALTSGADRLAMIALAVQDDEGLVPSSWELRRPEPSYTIDTLRGMGRDEGDLRLFFIMGMDSFCEIEMWKEHDALLRDYHLVVVNRPGARRPGDTELPAAARGRLAEGAERLEEDGGVVHLLSVPPQPASSTEIRRRACSGEPLRGLVAPPVESYIHRCALYRQ